MPRPLLRTATLREARAVDSPAVAELTKGTMFEVLDVTGDAAWGIGDGMVGYLDAAVLGITG